MSTPTDIFNDGPRVTLIARRRSENASLERALDTLRAQRYTNIEILEAAERDAAAAVLAAAGEFIAFVDEDTLLFPDAVGQLAGAMLAWGAKAISSRVTIAVVRELRGEQRIIAYLPSEERLTLFRRELCAERGFADAAFTFDEDGSLREWIAARSAVAQLRDVTALRTAPSIDHAPPRIVPTLPLG